MPSQLISVDFEVFGKVQGVSFRKYTEKQAKKLNLRGWCMNTKAGTVTGNLEGPQQKVEEMKQWLQMEGSPQSRIEKAEFKNERILDKFSHKEFSIRQ
ncbi:Acylphosphatase-1 [Blattella germanica]|nr:Acylphosphatase-1 [Blattella germanica]